MTNNLLRRVVLRNFKSIAACEVLLGPLTYLVGGNGAGKSNFLDALHFVSDALSTSLDSALNERSGLAEVRRKSSGHPTHFGIRLDLTLPDGRPGHYAFNVAALSAGRHEVQTEECFIGAKGSGPGFRIERGTVKESSEDTFPAVTSDRLALVAASGFPAFRPVFDALASMRFYNINPRVMRELQKPQDGRLLRTLGDNIASVIGQLEGAGGREIGLIRLYLRSIVPLIQDVKRRPLGHMETLEFRQDVLGAKNPWRFPATNMSDGTLRALGVLTALFQGTPELQPSVIGVEEPETALHPAASAALREALQRASERTQIIVTSHSPDLLDDPSLPSEMVRAVVSEDGETKIAEIDSASRQVLRDGLYSVGELLRLDQLAPDREALAAQQGELFGLLNR